jgi:hypothetical protein
MAEALETVNTTRKGVTSRGRWWPVGPKLGFDQMAALVPEIMDESLYTRILKCRFLRHSSYALFESAVMCMEQQPKGYYQREADKVGGFVSNQNTCKENMPARRKQENYGSKYISQHHFYV